MKSYPPPHSAAIQRLRADDRDNEFFTLFRYRPVTGLGYEPGVGRRDPSNIIRVDDTYFIWYTRVTGDDVGWKDQTETKRAFKWDLAEIWYATSNDGLHWTEQSCCLRRGPKGAYDDRSVFTPNILVAEGRYYLVYQTQDGPHLLQSINAIGMAVADSPHGPWEKLPAPILETGPGGRWKQPDDFQATPEELCEAAAYGAWDSWAVHDPGFLMRDGKYWLYYKGQQIGRAPFESKWGVAVADRPEGPYVKSEFNPITNSGHEVWVWPCRSGVAAMIDWAGPEKNTIQYAEDGLNFEMMCGVLDIPPAGGAYIPDLFTDTRDGQGFSWGLAYINCDWDYLVRFDCDLERGKPKDFSNRYTHYGKVLDVADNPQVFRDLASQSNPPTCS